MIAAAMQGKARVCGQGRYIQNALAGDWLWGCAGSCARSRFFPARCLGVFESQLLSLTYPESSRRFWDVGGLA